MLREWCRDLNLLNPSYPLENHQQLSPTQHHSRHSELLVPLVPTTFLRSIYGWLGCFLIPSLFLYLPFKFGFRS